MLRFAFLMIVIFLTYKIIDTQIEVYRERRIYEQINRQIEEQMLVRDDLERSLNNGTDADYIERLAREKLGYTSPDEKVYVDA